MEEEKTIDIKGTLQQFINTPEPELEQEEAIKKYDVKSKKKKSEEDATEGEEEAEHLKRVKAELLASLERVKKLEQQLYGQKEKSNEKIKQNLKTSGNSPSQATQTKDIKTEKVAEKERE